jgi:Ca-activated chloride channel homolog
MRIVRSRLFVAAQFCWACLVSAGALASNGQPTLLTAWSDLWRTPDQQAQVMLDAGEPAQAAARFHDPRRRAYADLQAGQYQEAARLLQPFTDAESEYNRGNALAKTGQLQAALAAYDAALKQSPADKDIRRNRDLVERALRQQPKSPQSNPGNGNRGGQNAGSPGRGQQSGQSGARQQGGGASAQSGGSSQPGDHGSKSGDRGSESGDRESQDSGHGSQPGDQGSASAGGQLASNGSGNPNGANSGSPSMSGRDSGDTQGGAGQAQRDAAAAAALAREQQRPQRGQTNNASPPADSSRGGTPEPAQNGARTVPDGQDLVVGGTQDPKQKPETERQLALDQWLRQIPDSPAGLLQRKFLIEHMIRQQESGNQQEDGQ